MTLKKVILLAVSVVVSLIIIEGYLRLFDKRAPIFSLRYTYVKMSTNPILGYELDEQKQYINSFGFKGNEFSEKKESNVFRIVALGDSVTFGCCGEPPIKSYPEYLREMLASTGEGKRVEVINAGVLGYNSVQEAEFFRDKVKSLDPDLLILQVTLNDYLPKTWEYDHLINSQSDEKQRATRKFYDLQEKSTRYLWKSYLYQFIVYLYSIHSINKNNFLANSSNQVLGDQTHSMDEWKQSEIIKEGFQNLKKMLPAKLLDKVVVVIFPYLTNNFNEYPSELLEEHQYISNLASDNKFGVLDIRSCYDERFSVMNIEEIRQHDNDTVHPNEYGHSLAAQCISDFLIDNFQLR